jgi:hypothetical protein
MRTKTLLAAAAALALSLAASQATPVYSANVVGYVNIPVTNNVITAVAPALDLDGTGVNNTVATVFTAPAIGDTVYVFNGTGYDIVSYSVVRSGHSPNYTYTTNWFFNGNLASNYPVNPGEGLFYLSTNDETITIVGTVMQKTNLVNAYFPTAGNVALLSSIAPISGGLTSVLGYNPTTNDTVYIYDNNQYDIYNYTVVRAGHSPNYTYTTNWFENGNQVEPVINVGQSFWLLSASTTNWTQNFIVQ